MCILYMKKRESKMVWLSKKCIIYITGRLGCDFCIANVHLIYENPRHEPPSLGASKHLSIGASQPPNLHNNGTQGGRRHRRKPLSKETREWRPQLRRPTYCLPGAVASEIIKRNWRFNGFCFPGPGIDDSCRDPSSCVLRIQKRVSGGPSLDD